MRKLILVALLSLSINVFSNDTETLSVYVKAPASEIKIKTFRVDRNLLETEEEQINGFIEELAKSNAVICNISYVLGGNYSIRRVIITYK